MFIMFSFEILRRKLVRGRPELTPFANDRRLNAVFVQLRIIRAFDPATVLCENEICGHGMNNSTSCRNKTIDFNSSTVKWRRLKLKQQTIAKVIQYMILKNNKQRDGWRTIRHLNCYGHRREQYCCYVYIDKLYEVVAISSNVG